MWRRIIVSDPCGAETAARVGAGIITSVALVRECGLVIWSGLAKTWPDNYLVWPDMVWSAIKLIWSGRIWPGQAKTLSGLVRSGQAWSYELSGLARSGQAKSN